jgi:hypothetical protein
MICPKANLPIPQQITSINSHNRSLSFSTKLSPHKSLPKSKKPHPNFLPHSKETEQQSSPYTETAPSLFDDVYALNFSAASILPFFL